MTTTLAVQAIRARGAAGPKVGPAENIAAAVPAIDTPERVKAAEIATRELNAAFLTVMLEGRYTDACLADTGADAPKFTDEDLKVIGTPLDFVGINVYRQNMCVEPSDQPPGYRAIPISASHPKMASAWHIVGPEAMYWAPRHIASLWSPKPIFITESGCAAADVIADDGNIYDTDRVMFLRARLTQLQRATSEGVPVNGYFLWSAQDNFEWIWGYGDRFGIVHVDFDTLKRTPKTSAQWFRETAKQNAVA
jgi:beta-glucosidase